MNLLVLAIRFSLLNRRLFPLPFAEEISSCGFWQVIFLMFFIFFVHFSEEKSFFFSFFLAFLSIMFLLMALV